MEGAVRDDRFDGVVAVDDGAGGVYVAVDLLIVGLPIRLERLGIVVRRVTGFGLQPESECGEIDVDVVGRGATGHGREERFDDGALLTDRHDRHEVVGVAEVGQTCPQRRLGGSGGAVHCRAPEQRIRERGVDLVRGQRAEVPGELDENGQLLESADRERDAAVEDRVIERVVDLRRDPMVDLDIAEHGLDVGELLLLRHLHDRQHLQEIDLGEQDADVVAGAGELFVELGGERRARDVRLIDEPLDQRLDVRLRPDISLAQHGASGPERVEKHRGGDLHRALIGAVLTRDRRYVDGGRRCMLGHGRVSSGSGSRLMRRWRW
ncbi:hypothetical protein ACFOJ6_18480 [Gordonia humi]|uniref:hypothetical protein n=1 Tax=Gordonia humi TaxID=686429 RepID=UPI00361DE47D